MIVRMETVQAGWFKLDGGAMFGVVPKKMWGKWIDVDGNNMITWGTRCLYIETDDRRKILVDTGIGDKQDERFRSHFEPHGAYDLHGSLSDVSINPEEITDVFLTHMHFDHVGGALKYDGEDIVPTFPNATYWTNKSHFEWAIDPNPRERASFLKENIMPLQELGVLEFIDEEQLVEWLPGIKVHFCYGHTEAMMLPEIAFQDKEYLYCADLVPSVYHIGMPYVMSYDVRPLETMKEKQRILNRALERNTILFLEHDKENECCDLIFDDKKRRLKINEKFDFTS